MKTVFTLFSLLFTTTLFAQDDLDNYIKRLKNSQATGGSETSFMSAGSEFMYGQDYFEKGTYDMAEMYFARARQMDSTNPYFNYQLAISLLKQKDKYKVQQAQPYLQKAFALNSSLQKRYAQDMPQREKPTMTYTVIQTGTNHANNKPQGLHAYLEELKHSRATGGAKTAMLTAGQEVMYGYDYYAQQEYASAETRFWLAVKTDPTDIYASYLLGISLEAQGKNGKAHLEKAFAGDADLKSQYNKEIAGAKAAHLKKEEAKKPVVKKPEVKKVGGPLTFGAYVCKQTVWNGPNANPQFSYQTHGTIHLAANGTYRWLDNGKTGRYSYDAKTGAIKWLSGHMAGYDVKSSIFQPNEKVPQITVSFTETYRWECGCSK